MDFKVLHNFFEGFATAEEENAIKAWLENSPENEKRFLEERKAYDTIILNSNPTGALANVAYNEEVAGSRSRVSFYIREIMKITAIVAVTLLGSWLFLSQQEDVQSGAMQTIHVPPGQRLNLTLPDGTTVWLNSKTTIQYPISFNTKERLIKIDGQAYFDVARNEKIPFVVETTKGQIVALGTQFDVLSYSDDDVFETTLMEGKVKVNLTENAHIDVILNPNNKVSLANGKLITSPVVDFSTYEWRNGLISFRDKTLEDIMESFEKIYDVKIVLQNPKLNKMAFTGKFRTTDGIEYALRVLQRNAEFGYERDTDKNIIYIK